MIRPILPCFAALVLAACAASPSAKPAAQAPVPAPAPAPATTPASTAVTAPESVATPAAASSPTAQDGIAHARAAFVRDTAQRFGIPAAQIAAVLANAQIRDSIIRAMARPAEAKPWHAYRPIFLQSGRIDGGRAFLEAHRDALQRAEDRYGVPKEIIVAILGVETNYGRNMGSYPVVDALYTLAFAYPRSGDPARRDYENRREAFFRDELAQLFALGRQEGFDITQLKGSYAGAMGWGQFMPSSYRQFAVDGDGDGRRDLFSDLDDVFASVAHYFVEKGGWQRGGLVMLPAQRSAQAETLDTSGRGVELQQTVAELQAAGYQLQAVPAGASDNAQPASLVVLEGEHAPEYWIVFNNFKAITKYNNSKLYATAVFQLAQAIAAGAANPA